MLFDNCNFLDNFNEIWGVFNLLSANAKILNCNVINNYASMNGAIKLKSNCLGSYLLYNLSLQDYAIFINCSSIFNFDQYSNVFTIIY